MIRNPAVAPLLYGCVLVILLSRPNVAAAQITQSFHDLQGVVNTGARLTITEQSGTVLDGRFVAASDGSLRVARGNILVDLSESSVAKIVHVRHRSGRGALVGLLAGAVVGALAVAWTPCSGVCLGPSKGAAVLPVAALSGGVGAGIGAGIGTMISARKVIYLAPSRTNDSPD